MKSLVPSENIFMLAPLTCNFKFFEFFDGSEYFNYVGQKVVEKERSLEEFYHTKMREDLA